MHKVSITFEIADLPAFRAAYVKALESSGLCREEQTEKLVDFDDGQQEAGQSALAEIISDSGFIWENYGLNF